MIQEVIVKIVVIDIRIENFIEIMEEDVLILFLLYVENFMDGTLQVL